MAPPNIFPLDRALRIDATVNGNIAVLGAAGIDTSGGAWNLDLVPDGTWDGSIVIVGRGRLTPRPSAGALGTPTDVPFVPVPFHQVYRAEAVQLALYEMVNMPLTNRSIIQIPSNGLDVGILINCNAGFAWLYTRAVDDSSAP